MGLSNRGTGQKNARGILRTVLRGEGDLGRRLKRLRSFSSRIRTAEYHTTTACNLRCQGCWFFEYEFDQKTVDLTSVESWRMFAKQQAEAGISSALLIGGEPSLFPDRVGAFVEHMPYVTVSSNGMVKLPVDFDRVAIALTLFGGEGADDELRAIRPSGQRFTGLFDQVLRNYRDDPRATFIFALAPDRLSSIAPTVQRIRDNGNILSFNYYSSYGSADPLRKSAEAALLEEALRVKALFPTTVINEPFSIETLITGTTHWGTFGYDVCPSVSTDHPAHRDRIRNGNPVLPGFNSYASDGRTLNFCCASGECDGCRDSQAVYSWILMSMKHFLDSEEQFSVWLDVAEGYWRQFRWSPYHPSSLVE